MRDLKDKVVLITGSSIGIGAEDAYKFASEGAKVIITYFKDRKEAEKVEERCKKLGAGDSLVLQLDVTNDESIKKCVKETVSKFREIDILINNAGVVVWKPLERQTYDEIGSQLRTNLEGLIKMTKEALPHIKEMIINISSGAGLEGYADLTAYCATKFGVRGFTQALAEELNGVEVYSVNPGTTATRMTGFAGIHPSRVAEVILNLAKGEYNLRSGSDVNIWEYV